MRNENNAPVLDGSREARCLIVAAEIAGEPNLAKHVHEQEQDAYRRVAETEVLPDYNTIQIPLAPEQSEVALNSLRKVAELNAVHASLIRAHRKVVRTMLEQYDASLLSEPANNH